MRGLRTKCTNFLLNVYSSSSDIIVITETGLDESFPDAVIFPDYFSVNRFDRSPANSIFERFGGVLIAIRKELHPKELNLDDFSDIEICCSKFDLASSKVYIVCVYIPPRSQLAVVIRYLDAIHYIESLISAVDKLYIFGDFNQTKIEWAPGDMDCTYLTPANTLSSIGAEIIDSFQSLGLLQLNPIKNHQNRSLDLIFSNYNDDSHVTRS